MQRVAGFTGPVELKGIHRRIEAWRQTRPGTRPMPEELWKEASGFARKLGIGRVARALRVNCVSVWQWPIAAVLRLPPALDFG
jgi:hypothetical protein